MAESAPAEEVPAAAPVAPAAEVAEAEASATLQRADESEVDAAIPVVEEAADEKKEEAGQGTEAAPEAEPEAAPTESAPEVATAETASAETYDPSMPAEPMEQSTSRGYDPSEPAEPEAFYDPSAPAEPTMEAEHVENPWAPADDATQPPTEPTQPAERYDPSEPAERYDPSEPAEQSYDPSQPAEHYDPSMPAETYDPSQPADPTAYDTPTAEAAPTEAEPSAPPAQVHLPVSSTDFAPQTTAPPALPVAAPIASTSYTRTEGEAAALPEGLTEESPSVVANGHLVHSWRYDPSDSALTLQLFNWAVQKGEIEDARAWYEVLSVENPTAASPLLALINLELAMGNLSQVEGLFARALQSSTSLMAAADVNIWKAYLHYIRRQNPSEGPNADKAHQTIIQAYEFALKECGLDRESGEIWQEYIQFLFENKSKNPWEQQQRTDTLRKVYQRAVAIPLNNVEALWKSYDAFESAQNKATAKKFLQDRSPSYMTARTALRELRNLTDILPHPVLPPSPEYNDEDRRVVAAWKNYLRWEEGDPLATEDDALVASRMGYALRKCMAQMRHFPELWHYAATYYQQSTAQGHVDEQVAFLKAGVAACPKSFLLSFALAELEEERGNFADCHKIFDALIEKVNEEVAEMQAAVTVEVEAARGPEIPPITEIEMNGEDSDYARLIRERDERGRLVQERRGRDVEDAKVSVGIVWVMYMRFARRAEGLKAARLVFGRARKSPYVTWHCFDAAAMMEYHSNKDSSVAVRIYELGLKHFSEETGFVYNYLKFLLSINDDTNARALFERSVLKLAPEKSKGMWEMWAQFEYMHGDLVAVRKLEKRWAEAFPNDSPLKRFAARYTYNRVDEIALRDLGFGKRQARSHANPAFNVRAERNLAAPATAPVPPPPVPANVVPPVPPSAVPPMPPFAPRAGASPAPPRSPIRDPRGEKRPQSPPHSPMRADKRARPASPRPRYPLPRERSPIPPPRAAPAPPPLPPAHLQFARSGLPKPVDWFVGSLPPAHRFDGPVFRADDIMGLFGSINAAGAGSTPPPAPPRAGAVPPRPPRGFEQQYRGRGRY